MRNCIVIGGAAKIRCIMRREGHYDDKQYTIRHFSDGRQGALHMETGEYSHPMTAIRSHTRSSGATTPPHLPTSRPSTSIIEDNWCLYRSIKEIPTDIDVRQRD